MAAARFFGALAFIALLGLAVSPVLFKADDEPPRPAASPAASPTASDGRAAGGDRTSPRLVGRYPKACLRPVASPGPLGLVATYRARTIQIATTQGEIRVTIRAPRVVKPPLAWSPSGTVLAAGPQGLFWRSDGTIVPIGDVQHGLVQGRRGEWGWSPLSDCGVHIDDEGALSVTAANPLVVGAGRTLIGRGVESFSFSPDGHRLGLVLNDDGHRDIWIVDLVRNRMQLVSDFSRPLCCISLGGWAPSGEELLYWAGSGNSVMADGWPMESVDLAGREKRWATTVPGGPVERCADDLVGLVGGDRFGDGARLAELVPGSRDRSLTDQDDRISSFSCSPDNNFFVVQNDARLALMGRDGAFVRYLTNIETPNGQWSERSPEWGPARTGILFVRSMHLQAQVWFLPEGQVTERPVADLHLTGRWDARSLFDWSATPPTGLTSG